MTRDRPLLPPVIAHVDMNTFFVSVERFKDPSLEGQPVVVGGPPGGRSVVSSASYEARRYGIYSAMPMSDAVRRCPDLVIVPPSFHDYQHFHDVVKAILQDFTPNLEMTSIDEGYLDLSGTEALWGSPAESGLHIRQRILDETALPCSIGISSNKLVSKVASDLAKPISDPRLGNVSLYREQGQHPFITSEGVLVVPPGKEKDFLAPLPISHLPGCGKVTVPRLQAMGLETVGDIAALTEVQLGKTFGELGRVLWRRANGQGSTHFTSRPQRKSISKEHTFAEDVSDYDYLRSILHRLTDGVTTTLRSRGELARTVHLKLRYEDFETHTPSRTRTEPTDSTQKVFDQATSLLENHWHRNRSVRLIGVGVSNLIKGRFQEDLFASGSRARESRRLAAVDEIRGKFGKDSLLTGDSLNLLKSRED